MIDVGDYRKARSAAIKLKPLRTKLQGTADRLMKSGPKRHDDWMATSAQIRALDFAIAFLETHARKGCSYTEGTMCCVAAAHGRDVAHTLVDMREVQS